MVLCKNCDIPMIGTMSFSKNRHEKFCRCPKCKKETKRVPINDFELDFREVLYKTIQN